MDNNQQQTDSDDELFTFLDFGKLLSDAVRFWWLFVLAVVVVFVGLKLYHRYCTEVWSAQATLIVDLSGGNVTGASANNSLIDGVMLGANYRNLDNQVAILGSRSLVERVVTRMDLCVSYYQEGRVRRDEVWPSENLQLVMDSVHVQPIGVRFLVTPTGDNGYLLDAEADKASLYNYLTHEYEDQVVDQVALHGQYTYGQPVITPWCAFTITAHEQLAKPMSFVFNDLRRVAAGYRSALTIERDAKSESSVLTLGFTGPNWAKNEAFLNTLIDTYLYDNVRQKNLMSENTIRFIEQQLGYLTDTLSHVETELSQFRSNKGLQYSISSKGEKLFTELQGYDKETKKLQLEYEYLDYLQKYFSSDTLLTSDIAPATFDLQRPVITAQLNKILEINANRQVYRDTYGKAGNPMYDALNTELRIACNTMLKSIKSHKALVDENLADIKGKMDNCNAQLFELPETERRLVGIDRKYTLNNDIYNFLMRKRSEAQIQRASNTSDHKVLDSAVTLGIVSPAVKRNQAIGAVLAFIVPFIFIVLRQVLDKKIRNLKDIEKLTDIPVVGEVPNSNKGTDLVVSHFPRSYVAEEFRRLRLRLDFAGKKKEGPTVILITSAMPADGKTFCAINLGLVYTLLKKRTVLLGFDLRKPGLSKLLKDGHKDGITDYLLGNCDFDHIVHNVDGLDVINSGSVPPNPTEVLQSDECKAFMDKVLALYDVVVIDTPPLGLTSDALLLVDYAQATVFVTRQDYTLKEAMQYAINALGERTVLNPAIIVNDINSRNTRYGYGYGYGRIGHYGKYGYGKYGGRYGYGYGYGEEKDT